MRIKLAVIMLILSSIFIASVGAQWSSLSLDYVITTNYHGKDVFPGTLVTATAGTTDPDVHDVTFVWLFPNDTAAVTDPHVPVYSNGTTWNGLLIYYANSSFTPNTVGDWGVQALFYGDGGHLRGKHSDIVAIRATSFNVIPEIPVIGTAGIAIAMLLGLGFYKSRKRTQK
ncbi:MAG: hypothetical protein ACUVT5_05865 [Candidatus Bathyarchaeales archaeon]